MEKSWFLTKNIHWFRTEMFNVQISLWFSLQSPVMSTLKRHFLIWYFLLQFQFFPSIFFHIQVWNIWTERQNTNENAVFQMLGQVLHSNIWKTHSMHVLQLSHSGNDITVFIFLHLENISLSSPSLKYTVFSQCKCWCYVDKIPDCKKIPFQCLCGRALRPRPK